MYRLNAYLVMAKLDGWSAPNRRGSFFRRPNAPRWAVSATSPGALGDLQPRGVMRETDDYSQKAGPRWCNDFLVDLQYCR